MRVRSILVDAEKLAIQGLELRLQSFDDIEIVATCHNGREAIRKIKTLKPDLVFLDIQMPFMTGLELLSQIPNPAFRVVFTTAFDQYTLKAFKLNSIDYLLKPILDEDLSGAIEKFKSFLPDENSGNVQEIKQLIKKEKTTLSRILVKIGYNLKIVQTHEVSCFFSENKIVYLQTSERTYPSDFTLDELEDVLDEKKFFRVNRQFIIHSDYIKNIHTSPNYKVELNFQPSEEITVSRDRVKDFKDWLVS